MILGAPQGLPEGGRDFSKNPFFLPLPIPAIGTGEPPRFSSNSPRDSLPFFSKIHFSMFFENPSTNPFQE